jgi:hypothetical protein
MHDVLILGGYGNFGKRIAAGLARHKVPVIVAGRNAAKAHALATQLYADYPEAHVRAEAFDADTGLASHLQRLQPGIVINACGPFQDKDYRIAETCIAHKIHYIDLADGRAFVAGISRLNEAAKQAGVCVISGASTVPALSSAVLDFFREDFDVIDELKIGISPGQKAERGLATTQAILSYIGKPLQRVRSDTESRYGWQDMYLQPYPDIGYRWMANCDVPDLDLLPARYGVRSIKFSAGMESWLLHLGIWVLGWLVRLGLPLDLKKHAAFLLKTSHWFDRFGTGDGGMHVLIRGKTAQGKFIRRRWFLIAKNGDGPQVPCVPAILLAKKLAQGLPIPTGAGPCLSLINLRDYLSELERFSIKGFRLGRL